MKIFLSVLRGDDRGTQAGQNDLATVGVAAQDQANAAIAKRLDEIRVVREQDDGFAVGGVTEGASKSCWSVQRSPTPESLSRAPPFSSQMPDVVQIGELCLGQSSEGEAAGNLGCLVIVAGCRDCHAPRYRPSVLLAYPAR